MAAHREGQDANLIAAGEAAASWARARRTAWTTAPLDLAAMPREPLPPIEFESPPTAPPQPKTDPVPAPVLAPAPRIQAVSPHAHDPSVGATAASTPPVAAPISAPIVPAPIVFAPRTSPADPEPPPFVAMPRDSAHDAARPTAGSPLTWGGRVAAAAVLIGAVALGWRYLTGGSTVPRAAPPKESAATPVGAKPEGAKAVGTLRITSSPVGAQVLVDGKARGVTPLTLTQLAPGRHDVVLRSDAGSVRRRVTVAANQTQTLDEQIFSGWVTVYSPFEVTIAEGQRVLRPDERNQLMLAPGVHQLRLLNKALGYETVLEVDVKPGEGANVRLTPPPSSLTVTAAEPAEVVVDGTPAGETPLHGFSVPLGTHEIIVKRATGAEKRYTVTIGVNPYTLNAVF